MRLFVAKGTGIGGSVRAVVTDRPQGRLFAREDGRE
jgi:hypothetical protein